MQRFLATPDYEGYFDFFSNIIVLTKYEAKHAQVICDAIAWKPGTTAPTETEMEIRALLKHEITHFLDMTTTDWGCQYIYRKLRMVQSLGCVDQKAKEAQSVFMLETSEVEVHNELLSTGLVGPTKCNTLKHELRYTKQFGTVLMIYYVKNFERCHEVPLSMLSLLEANATASEYLSRLKDVESLEDKAVRMLTQQDIELRFSSLLNDPARLEYSVLLHLVKIHFAELNLHELLIYVAALCRFALDASDMAMAAMANRIEESALNQVLGKSIAMELRRGANRPLIYFKTVLFMYGWMSEMEADDRALYLNVIRDEPYKAIQSLWAERLKTDVETSYLGFMAAEKQKWLNEIGVLADASIFEQSRAENAAKLAKTSAGLLSFDALKLMNVLLGDDTEIALPNRIDIPVVDYCDKNMAVFAAMDAAYRKQKPNRFHIPLDAVNVFVRS